MDERNEAEFAALREAEKRLYTACDKLFGGNMSEAFFGKMHPFSPINGHFYCENALSDALRRLLRKLAHPHSSGRVDSLLFHCGLSG